ncbi:EF-hand domain-containing protein [Sphingomonas sp. CGMCC 1.13654]|uniref:EF-hand domain-containing protein n=1 Tax=Sphingomonas chungangi TaxID=2683589 RepID=A0A838LAI0_9SPHN|nr:EF-hand domain-containing protein [Sphingomonas chungangi]MBA2936204.1 EF-hand domain-containing protein [Sphingomonas chungangi]MVW55589.1 histidine kinase [Sphingomonas chungangi]
MWRYLVGGVAALLMAGAGVLIWSGLASRDNRIPPPPAAVMAPAASVAPAVVETPDPPQATEKTKEQKRFSRYDHDKDGKIELSEYLQARRRNFDKLDINHDGKLSFDEYAAKAEAKFAGADADKSGALSPSEFATTRVVRKAKPRCAPARQAAVPAPAEADDDNG